VLSLSWRPPGILDPPPCDCIGTRRRRGPNRFSRNLRRGTALRERSPKTPHTRYPPPPTSHVPGNASRTILTGLLFQDSTCTYSRTRGNRGPHLPPSDRKSTRLNSSHVKISYAVFCLKKK